MISEKFIDSSEENYENARGNVGTDDISADGSLMANAWKGSPETPAEVSSVAIGSMIISKESENKKFFGDIQSENTHDKTMDTDEYMDALDSEDGDISEEMLAMNELDESASDDEWSKINMGLKMELEELGLMLNATLASEYDGANIQRLSSHFMLDWSVNTELKAYELGFPSFAKLLEQDVFTSYIEPAVFVDGALIYRATCLNQNEHILRRIADCKLNEEQRAQKNKMRRMLELKKPENAEAFIEGKRRILSILVDLKAYEETIDFQKLQDEYLKRYGTRLNTEEQYRLFQNKSATKNFLRAFFHEIDLRNDNPIRLRLKSKDFKTPEITEEDRRLVACIDKVEMPSFTSIPIESESKKINKFANYPKSLLNHKTAATAVIPSPTMDWGGEVVNERSNEDDVVLEGGAFGSGKINSDSKMFKCDDNFQLQDALKLAKSHDSENDDKYTGDEESDVSSISDAGITVKRKKTKPKLSSFNIPSSLPLQSLIAVDMNNDTRKLKNAIEPVPERELGTDNLINNKSNKRKTIAERTLQRSIDHRPPHISVPSFQPNTTANESRRPLEISATDKYYNQVYHPDVFTKNPSFHASDYAKSVVHCGTEMYDLSDDERDMRAANQLPHNVNGNNWSHSSMLSPPNSNGQYEPIDRFRECLSDRSSSRSNPANAGPSRQERHYVNSQPPKRPENNFQRYEDKMTRNVRTNDQFLTYSRNSSSALNVETQTDSEWLETAMSELGFDIGDSLSNRGSMPNLHRTEGQSKLHDLATTVELIVDRHAPQPVLLSALPRLVGSVYGCPLDLENDQNYRITWRGLINKYCSQAVQIVGLPNGENVLIKSPHQEEFR